MNSTSQLKVAMCVTEDKVQRMRARAAFPEIRVWFLSLAWWLTTLCNSYYREMWHSLLASMDPGIHVAHRHICKQTSKHIKLKNNCLVRNGPGLSPERGSLLPRIYFWRGVGNILYQTANEIIISFNIYYLPFWVKYCDVP